MSTEKIIELDNLTKTYQMGDVQVHALNGVSIEIMTGEFTAIMGPSGSGKSTMLNIIGCLDRPTGGHYMLDGEDVSRLSRVRLAHVRNQKIGFIFQSYNLLAQYTALENVMLPLSYSRNGSLNHKERLEMAQDALASVGLADRTGHKPTEMSGGQQQRVAIARALINNPRLILADEPTGNLDTQSGQEIMQILNRLHADGRSIVMVTHEAEIAEHAERTIHMRDGLIETIQHNGNHPKVLIPADESVWEGPQ